MCAGITSVWLYRSLPGPSRRELGVVHVASVFLTEELLCIFNAGPRFPESIYIAQSGHECLKLSALLLEDNEQDPQA